MYWYYIGLTRHPVAVGQYKIRGSGTIPSRYHYRIYPNIGKLVHAIFQIPCAYPLYVAQLDK